MTVVIHRRLRKRLATGRPAAGRKIYPYLLRNLEITRPDQDLPPLLDHLADRETKPRAEPLDRFRQHGSLGQGVPIQEPLEFFRPVDLGGGKREDARFRVVRLPPGTISGARLYFCHHFTRDLVWRDEWRQHANGAVGVSRAVVAASDPAAPGAGSADSR